MVRLALPLALCFTSILLVNAGFTPPLYKFSQHEQVYKTYFTLVNATWAEERFNPNKSTEIQLELLQNEFGDRLGTIRVDVKAVKEETLDLAEFVRWHELSAKVVSLYIEMDDQIKKSIKWFHQGHLQHLPTKPFNDSHLKQHLAELSKSFHIPDTLMVESQWHAWTNRIGSQITKALATQDTALANVTYHEMKRLRNGMELTQYTNDMMYGIQTEWALAARKGQYFPLEISAQLNVLAAWIDLGFGQLYSKFTHLLSSKLGPFE